MRCRCARDGSRIIGIRAGARLVANGGTLAIALRPAKTVHVYYENEMYIYNVYIYVYHEIITTLWRCANERLEFVPAHALSMLRIHSYMYLHNAGPTHGLAVHDYWHMYRCIPRCWRRRAGSCPSSFINNTYQYKRKNRLAPYFFLLGCVKRRSYMLTNVERTTTP